MSKLLYTFTTSLLLARLHVRRYLNVEHGRTVFTHEVWFDGLLGGVFGFILGRKFMKILPSVMEDVRRIGESRQTIATPVE